MLSRKSLVRCRYQWIRFNSSKKPPQEDDGNSALLSRFNQILESKIEDSTPSSLVDHDPKLREIYQNYSTDDSKDKAFRNSHQVQLGLLKSEPLLKHNNHARDIADTITNKPWDGKESSYDSNLRMIIDSKPPPIAMTKQSNRIMTPPLNAKDRLINAKESSLDYKVKKNDDKSDKEKDDDNWRELYRERLLGPSMLINSASPNTTLGLINKLSESAINSSINQQTGQFDSPNMSSVRGKPLDRNHLANSADSNYFINQILNKQEILPPWIENQQGIDREANAFRLDLDKKWFNSIFNKLKIDFNTNKTLILNHINSTNLQNYYLLDFHNKQLPFVIAKTNLINKSIRDYNLQCPSTNLHKFKLVAENELKKSFERVTNQLDQLVRDWFQQEEYARIKSNGELLNYNKNMDSGGSGLFGLFDSGPGGNSGSTSSNYRLQDPNSTNDLRIWQSIKDMFKS